MKKMENETEHVTECKRIADLLLADDRELMRLGMVLFCKSEILNGSNDSKLLEPDIENSYIAMARIRIYLRGIGYQQLADQLYNHIYTYGKR